jgi:hypothetical protein
MGPYHAIMVHFPVALWTVASGIIIYRALSDAPLARALDRVLVTFLAIGVVAGVIAYTLGQLVWPPDTLRTTPLGRNHMMGASWTLACWTAVLFLRWRAGERAWDGPVNRMIMAILGALGAGWLTITGTIGGHLHGSPAYLSELLTALGWHVYKTIYVPTWMLVVLAVVIVVMPVLAIAASRGPTVRAPQKGIGQ